MNVGDLIMIEKNEQWGFDRSVLGVVIAKSNPKKQWQHQNYKIFAQGGSIVLIPYPIFDLNVKVVNSLVRVN